MKFYAHERVALIVDGQNTWGCAHRLGLDIDWGKLHDFFGRQAIMVGGYYFTKLTADADGFEPVRRLLDWLDFNSWQVVSSDKDIDVELAVMVMELADSQIDHFVLATGDGKYTPLVDALKRWGKRVTILSSLKAGSVSEDLRRAADDLLELESLREIIARPARAPKEAVHA